MTLLASDLNGRPIQAARPGVTHTVAISGSSAAMPLPVDEDTRIVRCLATADCHLAIGNAPTAGVSDAILPAFTPEYFAVEGGADAIAAIRVSEDGLLYITEME